MSVKIGHSSIDENGKARGGKAGDQSKKEVCVRSWYNKPWDFVLRPIDPDLAERSAVACEKGCANDLIGYDQNERNTLNTVAKSVDYDLEKINVECECDCSSFMTVCAIAGGSKVIYGSNAPTTSTMKSAFTKSGDYDVLTAKKYLSSDTYLKRGDILVKAGSHTVMVLEDGAGSKVSDNPYSVPTTNVKRGSTGNKVRWVQWELNQSEGAGLDIDGDFGVLTEKAVRAFQTKHKKVLEVDGIVGKNTREKLMSV